MKKALLVSVIVTFTILFSSCLTPSAPVTTDPAQTPAAPGTESEGLLPKPVATGKSLELCLNSRYSFHNPSGIASEQQISNVLWAAGKMPVTGGFREIYVADQNATYLYDPNLHKINRYSDDTTDRGAFVLSFKRELHFDAGLVYMPAIVASIALWDNGEPSVSSCPMRSKLYFGFQEVRGFTDELVAHSSVPEGQEGWLPDPKTTGDNTIEAVLANLKYTDKFTQTNLTRQQISQLLWAGYGCTAHMASSGAAGLTVPSAMARYFLTESIYMVNEEGVYRYHNRNPGTDLKTRDHRLERIKSGDVRSKVQSAASGLTQAPCYIVLCLRNTYLGQEFNELEAGFVASNILMQATAIDLGCHFKTKLTSSEQEAIRNATGIPSEHMPLVVISIGNTSN